MTITLDRRLKDLRKEKKITQEALANHLGITVQAVSKWERAEAFPDVALLPHIASYFNVSVDDLLGVGEMTKEKIIEDYRGKLHKLFCEGKNKARVELMREAQKEFPNDHRILFDLMYALQADDKNANADEIIILGERILNESADNQLRGGAIQSLCFTYYYAKDDAETAKKYAKMADDYNVTVNELMPHLLDGEEAVQFCQRNIQDLFEMIFRNTQRMIEKGEYSPEDTIKAYTFLLDCFNLLYSDGDFGFYHCRMRRIYQNMAMQCKLIGNIDSMFCCLENAAEHTICYDTRQDGMYTSFMVNTVEMRVDSAVKDYEENDSALLLNYLNKHFGDFQHDERMNVIRERLEEIAVFSK